MNDYSYKIVENEAELQGAHEVRRQVFVLEQGIAADLVFEGAASGDEIDVVVKNQEAVIGTARVVFPAGATAKLERMAVLPEFQGKGIGRDIIEFLHGELKRRGVKHLILHAQYQVSLFYKSCGFEETGGPFQEAGIKHIKMEMHY